MGNWDEGGTTADSAAATEGKEILYPAGTGPAALGDWSARQTGSGRESDAEDSNEGDIGER